MNIISGRSHCHINDCVALWMHRVEWFLLEKDHEKETILLKEYIEKMPNVPGRSSDDVTKPEPPIIVNMHDMIQDLKNAAYVNCDFIEI